ncbi:ATP-binding protein [Nakamurella lactea]|uniref:ATP-binding protein n=1 Tax=Nakamurella lactea TaxID=459515 RepID=UPI0004180DDE|nr:ATP-binding protein [Nakamurella lactea]
MATQAAAADGDDTVGWMAKQLSRYREVREGIERETLPLATSVDGRTFEFQASLHGLELRCGGYVVLEAADSPRLGQVTDLTNHSISAEIQSAPGSSTSMMLRLAVGSGVLADRGAPFHDARIRPARPDEVRAWLAGSRPTRAALTVGELMLVPGVPADLESGGFNRHTFMCGQSGSGKTYSLGLLLERVLADTTLPVVILDPNSDYRGIGRLRVGADPELAGRYQEVGDQVTVWGAEFADRQLRLRFDELDPRTQAAVLGLDPVVDLEQYSALAELLAARGAGRPLFTSLSELLESPSIGLRQLGMRARNLGVLDWSVWSQDEPSILQEIAAPTSRCTVVDLGSLPTMEEQRLVADAVLAALWKRRHAREPVLVVIDEAHNICSADPVEPLSKVSTERAVQIAAEGRKYGLYLLVSTQRPGKVHENVVSQCDNLLLMRMNAASDLAELNRLFSVVPPGMMAGATTFAMGQALVSGRIFPAGAAYVQMGARVSQEGGADIPVSWAEPRRHQGTPQ